MGSPAASMAGVPSRAASAVQGSVQTTILSNSVRVSRSPPPANNPQAKVLTLDELKPFGTIAEGLRTCPRKNCDTHVVARFSCDAFAHTRNLVCISAFGQFQGTAPDIVWQNRAVVLLLMRVRMLRVSESATINWCATDTD